MVAVLQFRRVFFASSLVGAGGAAVCASIVAMAPRRSQGYTEALADPWDFYTFRSVSRVSGEKRHSVRYTNVSGLG